MKHLLQYTDLVNLPVQENGEELLVVQDLAPEIVCAYEKNDMTPYTGEKMYLRADVIDRLKLAAKQLDKQVPGAKLRLVYGYRHPDVQQKYFDQQKEKMQNLFPKSSEEEIRNKAHLLSASPDVAGHPAGAALDITITIDSKDLDMGTAIADFSDLKKIYTFSDLVTETQQKNRILLRELMMDQGFAPFDAEWWHFSYGDREWAAYYDKPHAIYGQISL